jgi:hypothetical protein
MIELLLVSALAIHDTQILKCGDVRQAKKLNEYVLPNGLLAEHYDTDGDDKKDVVALSSMTSMPSVNGVVEHAAMPTFYIIDTDHDGQPDLVYVDKNGDGNCTSLYLYEDLNAGPSQIKPGQVGADL